MSEPRPLHRLFGLSWIDFFEGTNVEVKTELDLSLKQQFLDVVIIRKGAEPIPRALPDGFEDLADHNLVTFKSHQEALDDWALWELVGHFVNYRKQSSPSMQDLLPVTDYRLFAVCARYPQQLAQQIPLTRLRDGVFEARGFGLCIRVIVVSQLPQAEQNAMLHLFSARAELLQYGRAHYRPHSVETSSLLLQLIADTREEANMDPRIEEFNREGRVKLAEYIASLPAEELFKIVTPEELRTHLTAKEWLKGVSVDDLVRVLPPETLKALAQRVQTNGSSAKSP